LHIIGHPKGLPLKIAGNAVVTKQFTDRTFRSSLDNFKGNSGSPVFNSITHEVEGLLARDPVGSELGVVPIPNEGCNGWEVAKSTEAGSAGCINCTTTARSMSI
jgi:hypothetical protein